MDTAQFTIIGRPATFATQAERPWKEFLATRIPRPSLDGRETGISLMFLTSAFTRNGQPFDVDNLCEPVFSVLTSGLGWFGGRRSNIQWWSAGKAIHFAEGCTGTIGVDGVDSDLGGDPFWNEVYTGVLPRTATSPELSAWAMALRHRRGVDWIPDICALHLGFADPDLNIAEIVTGRVKPIVDCLWPWLGGSARSPSDHRVHRLIVEKGVRGLPQGSVSIRMREIGRIMDGSAEDSGLAPDLRPRAAPAATHAMRSSGSAISNPCRPGTAKWIVCQGAIEGKRVVDVMAELDRLEPGFGSRLNSYKSDVRSENRIDVAIEGDRLVCRGLR